MSDTICNNVCTHCSVFNYYENCDNIFNVEIIKVLIFLQETFSLHVRFF